MMTDLSSHSLRHGLAGAPSPSGAEAPAARPPRAGVPRADLIAVWLNLVALMIVVTLGVGGATRITDSGLSITEWKPIVGVVPPLSEAAWQAEFDAYRQIPEYRLVNEGMSLDDFQRIYWWEWGHRLSGRLIGVVFAIPFLAFLLAGGMPGWLKRRLALLFALGGLQGAVGWWMVTSGLVERVDVSHYRLATHLGLACLLLIATVWTAADVRAAGRPDGVPAATGRPLAGSATALALLAALFVQTLLGALVAGLDAGLAYNTWPLMDGSVIPKGLLFEAPWWINPFENRLTVQFDHRLFAYGLLALAVWHAISVARLHRVSAASFRAITLFAAIVAQAAIGIHVVIWNVPMGLAAAHQLGAALLLWLATVHVFAMRHPRAGALPAQPRGL